MMEAVNSVCLMLALCSDTVVTVIKRLRLAKSSTEKSPKKLGIKMPASKKLRLA